MRFAVCNELLQNDHRDWSETCSLAVEAGYEGIEVAPYTLGSDVRDISGQDRKRYANAAHQAGLAVTGLHWLLVSPAGLSITTADTSVRLETARYLSYLVDFCADLGGGIMVLGSPSQRRIPPGDTVAAATDRLISVLEPALTRADRHGVTLCLEPLPAPESDFVMNLAHATTIIDRVQHPRLRTVLDVKSASSEQDSIPDLIERYASYIAHVHANDANRRGPGYGTTDFVPILESLTAINYTGFVSVEVFDDAPGPVIVATESCRYLSECLRCTGHRPEAPHA